VVSLLCATALDEAEDDVRGLVLEVYEGLDGADCALARTPAGLRLDVDSPLVRAHLCEAYEGLVRLYRDLRQEARAAPFGERAGRLGCRAPSAAVVRREAAGSARQLDTSGPLC
jgi:hypothetical protein